MTSKPLTPESAGARQRLEELFRRCSADLHHYVQRRLRRRADTDDLTQEVFERFIRGDWSTRAREPHAYLFGIASNVVAEAKMTARRNKVVYDSELSGHVAETLPGHATGNPESGAFEADLMRMVDRLSDVHRAALLLTKRDGLSCREAAERMGTTEGSVRVYVCEARARLKMLLKQT